MATINSHEASPSTSRWSYAAYLSFRGVDTRKTFTEPLYRALMGKGLHTFKDDVELKRGEALIPQCKKAIEGSRVSIIVLSKNYASSMWCLEELVIILKRRSSGHSVIPVFYDVGPNEVGNQTDSFKEAFMRHERRIETVKCKQKEYLGKVQAWRMALKEVTNLAGIYIFNAKISGPVYIEVITEFVTTNNRAHPGRQDRSDFCESLIEDERTRGKRSRDEISSHVFSLDILQRHFGKKRKDAAESLGISVSTFKRYCRHNGIPRWPNKKRNNVLGLPNPYGEKNPLPTFNTLSTNGQITMENEVGGQNLELNECLPDSFQDPNFQNTRIAVNSETEAAGGSSELVFQLEGQTTQYTAYPNNNALVFPQRHIASEEMLNENGGSSEDRRDLLASQAEASFEGHVSESSNLTVLACSDAAAPNQPLATMPTVPDIIPHLTRGFSEFSACPNLSGIVDPHPQIASTQILSENMITPEDLSIFLVSQEEPFMEDYGSGSINQTIPSCLDPAPSQQPMMPPLIASQDTSSVRVKATNGHTTIAFKLSFASGIIQLKEEVSKRLWFELGDFNLQYNDADGDLVSIACDDDVRDYLQLLTRNQVSKLFVS